METKKLLNWNCNGYYHHLEEIQLLISEYNPVILAIQETHLKDNQQVKLRNYDIIHKNEASGLRAHGGVLIAIRNDIHHEIIPLQSELQAVATKIYTSADKPITICSIYLPPPYHSPSVI